MHQQLRRATKSTEPITVFLSRNAAMIRVQEADREPKSKEARIVFYLSCIVRYLRAQSAKEPESARWVGVLDVRVPCGYKGGCSVRMTPICLPRVSTVFPKGNGPAPEAPARQWGRLCAGVTWRATDWIHLFTMHAYFLARKVGGRKWIQSFALSRSLGHRKRLLVTRLAARFL